MRVKLITAMSGLRDGTEWPAQFSVFDLPDDEAADYLASGIVAEVDDDEAKSRDAKASAAAYAEAEAAAAAQREAAEAAEQERANAEAEAAIEKARAAIVPPEAATVSN